LKRILEEWNDGIMEGWNDGILDEWNDGIIEEWNDGINMSRLYKGFNIPVPTCRDSSIPVFQSDHS
jgi:hypothetical protein